jgi:hypothetical protein
MDVDLPKEDGSPDLVSLDLARLDGEAQLH